MGFIKNITHLKCMYQMHSSHLVAEKRDGLLFFDTDFRMGALYLPFGYKG